ncbi:MAG: TolC family protein [Gemmatimonadetes bacterium]|jgi:outer membrane protein|nr:TolC family protein [Gemmatimonadota bacterium]MBT6149643.1 TolC family protein [Gemmatimonadota bacterium]MBT7863482.1 TolC family protein [Gemmatimonadota bacterium]
MRDLKLGVSISALLLGALVLPMAATAEGEASGDPTPVDPSQELILSVDDAVRLALESSRDLRDAQLAMEQADEQVAEVWGRVFPQIDFNASYVRNISPAVSFVPARVFDPTAPEGEFISLQFGADNSWQSSISVEQPLFDPALLVGLGAAQRFRQMQAELVRGRAQQVAVRVRLICYDLLLRAEEVRLTQRSLERVHQALAETEARRRAGMATDYDVLRLQVELANLEPNLLRARNDLSAARRQLAVELAVGDPKRLTLKPSLDLGDTTWTIPAILVSEDSTRALIQAAKRQRSDLRQVQDLIDLRHTEVKLQKVEYLPTVSLFGSWDVQAQQNGSPNFFGDSRSRATSKLAGVRLNLPIFTGLQRNARIDQRQAVLRQARTQAQLMQDQAAAQVRDLLARHTENAARVQAQRLAIGQAELGFQITLARYRRGVGSQLEITDAEVALRQSEFNHAQAAHDLMAIQTQLELALGRVTPVDDEMER